MFECLETGPRHEVGEFISDVIFQTYFDVNIRIIQVKRWC